MRIAKNWFRRSLKCVMRTQWGQMLSEVAFYLPMKSRYKTKNKEGFDQRVL